MEESVEKLYVIGRADLDPGLRAAQIGHALVEWCLAHPEEAKLWHKESNNLVLLEVPDEHALLALLAQVRKAQFRVASFREPDLDGQMTAFVVEPLAERTLSSLPLALRAA
jgi:peptidyl-tRNA hydrolase